MDNETTFIDTILKETNGGSKLIDLHTNKITSVISKASRTILQLNKVDGLEGNSNGNKDFAYNFDKNTLNHIARIIQMYQKLQEVGEKSQTHDRCENFESFKMTVNVEMEQLFNLIRKMSAVRDQINIKI